MFDSPRALYQRGATKRRALWPLSENTPSDYPFVPSDIAMLHTVRSEPDQAALDTATWDGMLLDGYCAHLAPSVSVFGRQVLYRRLRIGLDAEACAAHGARVRALQQESALSDALGQACACLRSADTDVNALLYGPPQSAAPSWVRHLWLPPVVLVCARITALLLFAPRACGSAGAHQRHRAVIVTWFKSRDCGQSRSSMRLVGRLHEPSDRLH